jgi:hypothetical protein
MSSEINLLQSKRSETASYFLSKIFVIRLISILILFTISFCSVVFFVLIALSPLPSLQDREKDELQKIAVFHPQMARIALTKDRLAHAGLLIQKRVVYNPILNTIEGLLTDDAIISGITLDKKNVTVILTSASLVPLDTFMSNLLTNNIIKKSFNTATLKTMLLNTQTGKYELTVEIVLL